jgi:hypothetical protein
MGTMDFSLPQNFQTGSENYTASCSVGTTRFCPLTFLLRLVLSLRINGAVPLLPLYTYDGMLRDAEPLKESNRLYFALSHLRRNVNFKFRSREESNSKCEHLFRMGAAVGRPVLRLSCRGHNGGIRGVIPGEVKRFFPSPHRPHLLWNLPNFLFGGPEADYSHPSNAGLRMSGAIPSLLHIRLCCRGLTPT